MPSKILRPETADLTAEEAHRLFRYDPDTGKLYNRLTRSSGSLIGEEAGTFHGNGYRRVTVRKRDYLAHRVIWLMHTGDWPEDQIDHKDLDKANNRLENLRPCTTSENHQNQHNTTRKGTSRYIGVCKPTGRRHWRVDIGINGKQKFLGGFRCETAAYVAYCKHKAATHLFVANDK